MTNRVESRHGITQKSKRVETKSLYNPKIETLRWRAHDYWMKEIAEVVQSQTEVNQTIKPFGMQKFRFNLLYNSSMERYRICRSCSHFRVDSFFFFHSRSQSRLLATWSRYRWKKGTRTQKHLVPLFLHSNWPWLYISCRYNNDVNSIWVVKALETRTTSGLTKRKVVICLVKQTQGQSGIMFSPPFIHRAQPTPWANKVEVCFESLKWKCPLFSP